MLWNYGAETLQAFGVRNFHVHLVICKNFKFIIIIFIESNETVRTSI